MISYKTSWVSVTNLWKDSIYVPWSSTAYNKDKKEKREAVHLKMLSKIKNVSRRREYESNTGNAQCDLENSQDRNDKKLFKKVFFDAAQVEDFLTSEYFTTEEFLSLGCWENCSVYSNERDSLKSIINKPAGSRPITALALMLLGQYSSLPRSNQSR